MPGLGTRAAGWFLTHAGQVSATIVDRGADGAWTSGVRLSSLGGRSATPVACSVGRDIFRQAGGDDLPLCAGQTITKATS